MPLVVGDRARMQRTTTVDARRPLSSRRWIIPLCRKTVSCFRACVTANHTWPISDEALNIISATLRARGLRTRPAHPERASGFRHGERSLRRGRVVHSRNNPSGSAKPKVDRHPLLPKGRAATSAIFFRKLENDADDGDAAGRCVRHCCGASLLLPRSQNEYYRHVAAHRGKSMLDNADGVRSRVGPTRRSRTGRVTDSVVDPAIFRKYAFHLAFRCLMENTSLSVTLLGFSSGYSHILQAAAADYYRNAYLYFVTNRARGDLDSSVALGAEYQTLTWREHFWSKLFLALYLNFTRQQETLSPGLKRLRETVDRLFHDRIPDWFQNRYRDLAKAGVQVVGWVDDEGAAVCPVCFSVRRSTHGILLD